MYEPSRAPQSIGGVLDDGFRLYRAALWKVAGLAFVSTLVGQAVNMLAPVGTVQLSSTVIAASLVSMVVSMFCYAAALARMNAVAEQREMTLGEALAVGLRRLLPLLVFSVLYGIIVGIGFVLLLVPAILFGVSLVFGFLLVVLEGRGPLESLPGSHRLVWGHWWRTMVMLTVATIILFVVYLLIGFIAGFGVVIDGGDVRTTTAVLQLVVVPVLGALVVPLFYALTLAVYYDLRLRRSGEDLEQRLGSSAQA